MPRTAVARPTTASRRPAPAAPPPPARQIRPRRATWPAAVLAQAGVTAAAAGGLWLVGRTGLIPVVLAVSVVLAAAQIAVGIRGTRRERLMDQLTETIAPLIGGPAVDRRLVRASKWRGWPGAPRRLVISYAPAVTDTDPTWKAKVLTAVSARMPIDYEIAKLDARRCRLILREAHPAMDGGAVPAVQARAEQAVADLLGPTAAVTGVEFAEDGELARVAVQHQIGHKVAVAGYRLRVERVLGAMFGGRWRAHWDLTGDTVVFETRPSFPDRVWLPPLDVDPTADLLASYDKVRIPFGVSEDGEEMIWRPAIDPNIMVVGPPGSGKPVAVDTPVPTPAGWTTMGELSAGDLVFDETGAPCTVTAAHPVLLGRDCYRITFSDGSSVVADADHLWQTSTKAERAAARRLQATQPPRTRLNPDQMLALRTAITDQHAERGISVPDVARLVGMHPSAEVLRRIRACLPVVARRERPMRGFVYREHRVSSTQPVELYSARDVYTRMASVLEARALPGAPADRASVPRHRVAGVDESATVSRPQLRVLLGVDREVIGMLLRRSGLAHDVGRERVERMIPAHTEYRQLPGPPIQLYDRRTFLGLLERWAAGGQVPARRGVGTSSVRSTAQIAATLRTRDGQANHTIPVAGPIDCPAADVPIPPYTLGAWIGDGDSRTPTLTSGDPEVVERVASEGVPVVDAGIPGNAPAGYTARRYPLGREVRRALVCLGLLFGGGALDSNTRHIPRMYLRASIDQRRALLAGLLDTDGTVSRSGAVQYTTTSPRLAGDVLELARSLGYRATSNEGRARLYGKDCGPTWTIAWTTPDRVFGLDRKHETHQERVAHHIPARTRNRYIVSVEQVPSVPVRCISVDSPNRLFLVGEAFIPTHNTVAGHTLLVQATRYGWPVWVVDGKSVEFLAHQDWPNVQVVATSIQQQVAVIHRAWELMEHRYTLITSGRASAKDFTPLLLFIDEWADFRGNLTNWYAEVKVKGEPTKPPAFVKVSSLARKGRTSRVHLVFGTQRPDAEYFGGDMRDNFRARISMGRLSPQGAMMMWENPSVGVSLPRGKRGRGTAIDDDNRPVEVQVYLTPNPGDVAPGSEEAARLEQLRPAAAQNERLLILPPRESVDPDTGEVAQVGYYDWAQTEWALAVDHPGLDPVRQRAMATGSGRDLASPLTMLGVTGTPGVPPTPSGRLVYEAVDDEDTGGDGNGAEGEWGPSLVEDGYGPAGTTMPMRLEVGDLLQVDDRWVVVDLEPDVDAASPGYVSVFWRDDADDQGVVSVPDDELVTVRRPLDMDGGLS